MSAGAEASQEFIQGDFAGWQPEEHWERILDRKVLTSRRVTPFPRTDSNQTSRWPVKINQVLHQCMMSQLEQLPWQPLWMEIPSFFSWNQSETLLSVNSFAANQGGQQVACPGLTLYDSGFFPWRGKQAPRHYPDKDIWAIQHDKLCMMYFKCQEPVQSVTWNDVPKLLMREKEADKLNGDHYKAAKGQPLNLQVVIY